MAFILNLTFHVFSSKFCRVPPVMAIEQPVKRGYHGILTVIRVEESRLKEQTKAIRQMARLELCYS